MPASLTSYSGSVGRGGTPHGRSVSGYFTATSVAGGAPRDCGLPVRASCSFAEATGRSLDRVGTRLEVDQNDLGKKRNVEFPADGRPIPSLAVPSDTALGGFNARARQLSSLIGFGVPAAVVVAAANWLFIDTAHRVFGTVMPPD